MLNSSNKLMFKDQGSLKLIVPGSPKPRFEVQNSEAASFHFRKKNMGKNTF